MTRFFETNKETQNTANLPYIDDAIWDLRGRVDEKVGKFCPTLQDS